MNNRIKSESGKRSFYQALASLVIPIVIQNFITNAVNSADVLMLGYVGQSELSAVSLANQFQFLIGGFFFGIASGVTILSSQYWGKKDTDTIQAVMGIAIKLGLVVTVIVSIGAVVFPDILMRIYTNDEELIEIGVRYLRIVGFSYVLMSFSQVYQCTLRSIERAKISTMISACALGLNVLLNAVFIFGLFGIPKLGVIGVALATLIARITETLLCFMDACAGKAFKLHIKKIFAEDKLLFQDFLKYCIPALVNDLSWTVAFSMYSVILGHMNADVVAASSVATTVRDLCTIVCFALSAGVSVLLGIEIGEGRMEDAKQDARRACVLTFVVGILTAGVVLLLRPFVHYFFDLTDRANIYLNVMLWISSYYVIGQAMNTLIIVGIFRAGGDTKFGMICDTITMWCVSLPLGFLSAFVLKLPPMVVYFILCLDEFWKIPVVYKHYKSYKWLRDITR